MQAYNLICGSNYTAAKDLQNYIDIETNWYEVEI